MIWNLMCTRNDTSNAYVSILCKRKQRPRFYFFNGSAVFTYINMLLKVFQNFEFYIFFVALVMILLSLYVTIGLGWDIVLLGEAFCIACSSYVFKQRILFDPPSYLWSNTWKNMEWPTYIKKAIKHFIGTFCWVFWF